MDPGDSGIDSDPRECSQDSSSDSDHDLSSSGTSSPPRPTDLPANLIVSVNSEDEHDPFQPEHLDFAPANISALPPHLLVIYCVVSWLHCQFHLPRIACDALLTIFAMLVFFLAPSVEQPFVTLKSVNSALGVSDVPIHILAVCPDCREVFSGGCEAPDACSQCTSDLFSDIGTAGARKSRTPIVRYPYLSISEQLASIVALPGVEDVLDSWRNLPRQPGIYQDIFDGRIAKEMRGPDGKLFFSNKMGEEKGPDGELRLGLNWGVDWFSYIRSANAPSHSSCPTSFSISNLPSQYQYRTANLICTSILPGSKEQTGDELQRFIHPGRRIRVVLLAVVCDKPAAHKIGGFGSHSHTCYCTMCWITIKDKKTAASFTPDAFRTRTNEEHRRLGDEYQKLKNASQRAKFVKKYATRYTQLSRLPYFDIVRQIVIDPMHNLLMGLTKTHFHTIWVQGKILREKHELRVFHEMLASFTLPTVCGKLPKEMGLTSGGSLTADQWLLLATVCGPIIVSQLWSTCIPENFDVLQDNRVLHIARQEATAEKKRQIAIAEKAAKTLAKQKEKDALKAEKKRIQEEKKAEKAAADQKKREERARKKAGKQPAAHTTNSETNIAPAPTPTINLVPATPMDDVETTAPDPPFALHPDDPANFLKLSSALSIFQQEILSEFDITRADGIIRSYCTELITLYGASSIKPNHHYATHTGECVRNFGPLRGFWTFLFERLNKLLKSVKTNNHGNGELETTFFREFHQTCQLSRVRFCLSGRDQDSLVGQASEVMNKASKEDRGTVAELADLSRALDRVHRDVQVSYGFSPTSKIAVMRDETYRQLAGALTIHFPTVPVHCISDSPLHPDSLPLTTRATFYNYVIVNGRRYYASSLAKSNRGSLIQVSFSPPGGPVTLHCGELIEIFKFQQYEDSDELFFGRMRWFTPYRGTPEPVWDQL
ncbi:hypothetical protein C8R43DRAFT_897637 [Mycena crocata]|nr:hypothetical protein C8R43DRAFT_897637 [Mycena crocata]